MKKRIAWILVMILLGVLVVIIFLKSGLCDNFVEFTYDYSKYIKNDIEHQAELFESIVGGICAGCVTFGALFITILYENKKNKLQWQYEREQEEKTRLFSVRPFLNIEVKSVSVARNEKYDEEIDCVLVGNGNWMQYAHLKLSNHGYGKCKKIMLDGHKCSITQLDVDEQVEFNVYFKGLENGNEEKEISMFICYQDIFGNEYLQEFCCYLKSHSKELVIEIGKPLLKRKD